jgi:hypothetical protein
MIKKIAKANSSEDVMYSPLLKQGYPYYVKCKF